MTTTIPHDHDAHPHRWAMRMTWHDVLFLHWAVDGSALAPLLPEGLALDTFDGRAYLSVIPFTMSNVRPRAIPAPLSFAELNVRTYVTCRGTPGVWFFSLDAASKLAVRAARTGFHLPYFDADFVVQRAHDGAVHYRARGHVDVDVLYAPTGPVFLTAPGTLEHFLAHRLVLYAAANDGTVFRGDIWHPPWPLMPARAEIRRCEIAVPGVTVPHDPPLAHYARRIEVVGWWRKRVWPVDVAAGP